MNAYFKGLPISGPRGPAGPDGNPIGTVISFMGLTAPKDYLVCDGAEYPVADYPDLAAFFRRQFGSANCFGGDGETTFAVPDMRNLFLRGFHGEAEEQLSGEIGQRQEATRHVNLSNVGGTTFAIFQPRDDLLSSYNTEEADSNMGPTAHIGYAGDSATLYPNSTFTHYTARPVNMAVLYCVKAVESVPAENAYSAEETRIGTWIDGKPLYRAVYTLESAALSNVIPLKDPNITPVKCSGMLNVGGTLFAPSNYVDGSVYYFKVYVNLPNGICAYVPQVYTGGSAWFELLYTKNTD